MGSEITHHDEIPGAIAPKRKENFTMKKKLFPFLLAILLLLLTACTPGNSERGKELGYFNYPGLDWGMTEEEFLKEYDLASDSMQVETSVSQYGPHSKSYLSEKINIFGTEAGIVRFYFWAAGKDEIPRFTQMVVEYNGDFDYEKILNQIREALEKQESSVLEPMPDRVYTAENGLRTYLLPDEELFHPDAVSVELKGSFVSETTVADLPEEMKKRTAENMLKMYYPTNPEADVDWASLYASENLSIVRYEYSAELDDAGEIETQNMKVVFEGRIADVDIYADLAE